MPQQNNANNSLAHTKWNCKYHVVFAPKYRRKVFYADKREAIRDIIRTLCEWVVSSCCGVFLLTSSKSFSKSYLFQLCRLRVVRFEFHFYDRISMAPHRRCSNPVCFLNFLWLLLRCYCSSLPSFENLYR